MGREAYSNFRGHVGEEGRRKAIKVKDDYSATIVERAKLKHVCHTYSILLDSTTATTSKSGGRKGEVEDRCEILVIRTVLVLVQTFFCYK